MRDIKFRAWDGVEKTMEMPSGMVGDYIEGMICRCGDFNLMQYTGIKDINGTDVFEGDVLCLYKYDVNAVVKWNDDIAGFVFYISDDEFLYADETRKLKIIGNIYETPELLR